MCIIASAVPMHLCSGIVGNEIGVWEGLIQGFSSEPSAENVPENVFQRKESLSPTLFEMGPCQWCLPFLDLISALSTVSPTLECEKK